jgi:hypothetical protein
MSFRQWKERIVANFGADSGYNWTWWQVIGAKLLITTVSIAIFLGVPLVAYGAYHNARVILIDQPKAEKAMGLAMIKVGKACDEATIGEWDDALFMFSHYKTAEEAMASLPSIPAEKSCQDAQEQLREAIKTLVQLRLWLP